MYFWYYFFKVFLHIQKVETKKHHQNDSFFDYRFVYNQFFRQEAQVLENI